MQIKWNAGIAPAQIGQEVTRTGIDSVANGRLSPALSSEQQQKVKKSKHAEGMIR